jgi:hypothetical protein
MSMTQLQITDPSDWEIWTAVPNALTGAISTCDVITGDIGSISRELNCFPHKEGEQTFLVCLFPGLSMSSWSHVSV